ncbi:hypothetical protein F5148DRAFT_1262060, partial [Russula earlei]
MNYPLVGSSPTFSVLLLLLFSSITLVSLVTISSLDADGPLLFHLLCFIYCSSSFCYWLTFIY